MAKVLVVNDYLTKPFSPRDLETRAQLLLQRH